MSEYLAHAAVYDDVRRLALRDEGYPEAFHTALREHSGYGRAGSITRGMFYHVVPLLDRVRAAWAPGNESAAQRLAFALGWISHRAADRHIKAMAVVTDPAFYEPDGTGVGISRPRIWHDLVLYDAVYEGGRSGVMPAHLFSRDAGDHPAAAAFDVTALEPVVQAEWAGELAALHSGVGEADYLEARLDAFLDARPEYYVPLDDYADRIERPFPEEEQRFVRTAHFYDADDPLVALARAPEGEGGSVAAARAAVGPASSQYAVILERAMAYVDAAAAYWRGEASTDAVREALDFNTWARGPEETAASRALLDGYAR
jgi:hypothetical protein